MKLPFFRLFLPGVDSVLIFNLCTKYLLPMRPTSKPWASQA